MTLKRRTFLKQSAMAATASIVIPGCKPTSVQTQKRIGFQVWSIAKELERDFMGSIKLLSQIGYQDLELFGPYPFSSEKDKTSWNAIVPMVGFSQSGYFGRDIKEFKQILQDHGLRTPAMHIGLDTLRHQMDAIGEATQLLGQSYVGIAAIPEDERKTLDAYKRIADDFNDIGKRQNRKAYVFIITTMVMDYSLWKGRCPSI